MFRHFTPVSLLSFCQMTIPLAISLLVLLPSCSAQQPSTTWRDLQQLQPGTELVVVTAHRLSCTLVQVSDDEIQCRQAFRSLKKNRVQEVRLGAGRKGAILGAMVGAAAGGGLASTSSGGNQGVKIIAGVGLGAAVGGVVGLIAGKPHGKLIYRQ